MRATFYSTKSFSRFECKKIGDNSRTILPVEKYSLRLSYGSQSLLERSVSSLCLWNRSTALIPVDLPPVKQVQPHEFWDALPDDTIGRIVSFMTLKEVSSLRCISRHWRTSIDRSVRTLRAVGVSRLPIELMRKFLHLERLTVDHMDEMHFCDLRTVRSLPALRYLSLQGMKLSNESLESIGALCSLMEFSATDITLQKNCSEALCSFSQLTQLTKLCLKYIDVEKIDFGGNYFVENIAKIPTLKHLELRFDMSTDVLEDLSALTLLETLCLSSSTLYIPNLHFLQNLSRLRHLSLPWTHFSIYEAKEMDLLTNLTFLDLGATDVTDDSLLDFYLLTNLRHLSLKDDCIGDASVEHLSALTDLLTLDISHGAGLSDVCTLDHISELHSLKLLNLNGTHIGDSDLEKLIPLTNLERLDIGLTCVTDTGINSLTILTNLKEINTEIVRNHFDRY